MTRTILLKEKNIFEGNLILVNSFYLLQQEEVNLSQFQLEKEIMLDYRCATMLEACIKEWGYASELVAVSGYRSYETQKKLWDNSIREHGEEYTRRFVAIPKASEHQTGLAVDLGKKQEQVDFICPELPYDGIFASLRSLLVKYGFAERYLLGKEEITCIHNEPWHFRYVGFPHSEIMTQNQWVLEEYQAVLKQYTAQCPLRYTTKQVCFEIFYVEVKTETKEINLSKQDLYQISGNNMDGVVVTTWRRI